jgi:DNA-binding MarR family transcriptional regulator
MPDERRDWTGDGDGAAPAARAARRVTLLYLIKQVELAVRTHLDAAVASEGLTSLQYTALTALDRHPGITSAVLARNSFVRPQTMAQMITALLDKQLIERAVDPTNRRQMLLALTPEGKRVLDRLAEPVAKIELQMIRNLREGDVANLREDLESCQRALAGSSSH